MPLVLNRLSRDHHHRAAGSVDWTGGQRPMDRRVESIGPAGGVQWTGGWCRLERRSPGGLLAEPEGVEQAVEGPALPRWWPVVWIGESVEG